jgi:hypothetical protein
MARRQWAVATVVLLALILAACSHKQTASQEAASSQPAKSSTAATTPQPSASQPAPATSAAPAPAPAPPAPVMRTYTLAAGTPLHIHLTDGISTETATPGATFSGTLSAPLVSGRVVVAPTGSEVTGQVTAVEKGGRLRHPASLALVLTSLKPRGGNPVTIATHTWAREAASHKKRNVTAIGGGAGLGALIGAVAGKGKGAAIGAAVGAGAGTAGAAFTGQKQLVLAPETPLRFTLSQSLSITEQRPQRPENSDQ